MFIEPSFVPPFRVMIFGACRDSWYTATDDERTTLALPALQDLLQAWEKLGLVVLESFDDDLFLVGQPGSLQFSFFIIAETPSVDALVQMMNLARKTHNGLRADRYFRFEARLGRTLFMLDK